MKALKGMLDEVEIEMGIKECGVWSKSVRARCDENGGELWSLKLGVEGGERIYTLLLTEIGG